MAGVIDSVDQRTRLAGHNRLELLTFCLTGNQKFGLNVFKIQEVVQCPALTQMPNSHPAVKGVATLRGKNIPVLDLSMATGGASLGDGQGCFVIVTEYNRSVQGFLVRRVDRIVNLNWSEILPPPAGTGNNSYLTAVTKIDDKLVEIIDVEKVLAEVTQASTDVSEEIVQGASAENHNRHVLVVDDSSVARGQIKRTLDQIGVEITLARNGQEAIALLKKWADNGDPRLERLAIVISDIEMPEMDGYTLTTSIRDDARLRDLYILLHTSLSGTFNSVMVQQVGADQFVPKFKPDELALAVLDRIKQLPRGSA